MERRITLRVRAGCNGVSGWRRFHGGPLEVEGLRIKD
jgi:hypothetical protein